MEKDIEKLINESPIFDISEKRDHEKYTRERYKLIENLYNYLIAQNKNETMKYGKEIVETVDNCIKGFDKTKGIFLHYFNKSFSMAKKKSKGEEKFENKFRSLGITDNEKRAIKNFKKYVKNHKDELNIDNFYELISKGLQITVKKVKEIEKMSKVQFVENECTDDEGDVVSIFDRIVDNSYDKEFVENKVESILGKIEDLYDDLQDRQKPIVSDMMTCDLADELIVLSDALLEYNFVNKDMLKDVEKTGEKPSQRDIAKKYGKNEASISRTMREFKGKLKEQLKQ